MSECSRCGLVVEPGQGWCLYRDAGGRDVRGIKYSVHAECIAEDVAAGRIVRVSPFAYEPIDTAHACPKIPQGYGADPGDCACGNCPEAR